MKRFVSALVIVSVSTALVGCDELIPGVAALDGKALLTMEPRDGAGGGSGGSGQGSGDQTRDRLNIRLQDGSCSLGDGGAILERDRDRLNTRDKDQARDGSCGG